MPAFSSTTTTSSASAARSASSGDSGWTSASFSTLIPAAASISGVAPPTRNASITSPWALPTAAITRRGRGAAMVTLSTGLARAKALTAASLKASRRSICRPGRSGQRQCSPSGPASIVTGANSGGGVVGAEAEPSTVSLMAFSPT